jgi:L-arabinonolactonase
MLRMELLIDLRAELGEGPLWDEREQRIYWIDSLGALVHSCDAVGGGWRQWPVPGHIGSLALCETGGAVVALQDGFYRLDFATGLSKKIGDPDPGKPRIRLDADLTIHKLADGIICSNGPCWSPDGKLFYFADTGTREIFVYDYDLATGNVSNRRLFACFAALNLKGLPDGATVDADGFIWSVSVYEGKLVRFAPDGAIDQVIGLPVESTTSVAFGGANLDVAYVTSMARTVKGVAPRERAAGGLFAIHGLGVRGIAEARFKK